MRNDFSLLTEMTSEVTNDIFSTESFTEKHKASLESKFYSIYFKDRLIPMP